MYVNILDQLYSMQEIPKYESVSREFDNKHIEKKPRKKYIPPLDHPWRTDNILNYFGSQKHRQDGTNV